MKRLRTIAPSSTQTPRGFPSWAWWTLFLATFTFAVPLTSPWWSGVLRAAIPGSAEEDGSDPTSASNPAGAEEPPLGQGSMLRVVLHTRVEGVPGLGPVEREIPYVRGVVPQIQAAVSELGVASTGSPALLPEGTRVLDVAYSRGGTAYIDFSAELDRGRGVGAEEEKALVQGIVHTVTDNFAAVRRVVILIDGKAPKSGHLDLTRSLRRDDPILADDDEPLPDSSPEQGASPAPSPAAIAAPTPPAASKPKTAPAPVKPIPPTPSRP